ncbi:MAG: PQQ-dependent sugar dehydrogenase [Gemmatimonadetes bacterium]|nr:PQQ-dependent sugar dehydrogenase [Gemmatimonadota bacterium]
MARRSRLSALRVPSALLALAAAFLPASSRAGSVPAGFLHEYLVGPPFGGWPVAFALLPDGRPLIAERETGTVRVAAVGATTSVPVLTLPDVESVHPERGLLGVAVDPDWPASPYLYLNYTSTAAVTKIVRVEATGDLSDPASTALAFGTPAPLIDSIEDLFGIHNAGTLRFGPDGRLLISVGDDQRGCLAQDLDDPHGKILRISIENAPAPGGPAPPLSDLDPGDNPFGGTGWRALVWAWGLRNPFRFTVDAPTGDVFIGSVGSHTFEEMNVIPGAANPGPNFGWPEYEGFFEIACCGDCPLPVTYTWPIYALPHPLDLISIIGGPRVRSVPSSPISFPPSHEGDLFFFELYSGHLVRLQPTGALGDPWEIAPPIAGQPADSTWGTGFPGAADAQLGPDGALWFTSLGTESTVLPPGLHRIRADTSAVDVSDLPDAPGEALRALPNPSLAGRRVEIRATGPLATVTTALVVDAAGRRVRALSREPGAAEDARWIWDGRAQDGSPTPAGIYFFLAEGNDGPLGALKITRLR